MKKAKFLIPDSETELLIEGKVPKEFKKVSFPEERKLSKSLNYYPLLNDK